MVYAPTRERHFSLKMPKPNSTILLFVRLVRLRRRFSLDLTYVVGVERLTDAMIETGRPPDLPRVRAFQAGRGFVLFGGCCVVVLRRTVFFYAVWTQALGTIGVQDALAGKRADCRRK